MRLYLLEYYDYSITFEEGSKIVALTPKVCYLLDKKGIQYSVIDDYYDSKILSDEVEPFRQYAKQWISQLDDYILKTVPSLKYNLGEIYQWYIKGRILDPIYIRCYELKCLLDILHPEYVTFITQEPESPALNLYFDNYGCSLYYELIRVIYPINKLTLLTIHSNSKAPTPYYPHDISLSSRFINLMLKTPITKRLYFLYRYLKRHVSNNSRNSSILILQISHIGENIIAQMMRNGYRVYTLSDNAILKYTPLGVTQQCLYNSVPHNSLRVYSDEKLRDCRFIKDFSDKCHYDISDLIIPRLKHFLSIICPILIRDIAIFEAFYSRYNIRMVLCSTISTPEDFTALAVAKKNSDIKTVCLAHGDSVYDSQNYNLLELNNCDNIIVSNKPTERYYDNFAKSLNKANRIYTNSHRISNLRNLSNIDRHNNIVVYLPLPMRADTRRMDSYPYGDTRYYQLQKAIIEYFATRTEYNFVYKTLLNWDWAYNPILDLIKDKHYPNISISVQNIYEHLKTAGRLICDCPSTSFFQSVYAKVPIISLYNKAHTMRPELLDYYNKLLKPYTTIPEAINHIKDFLNSPSDLYKAEFETNEFSLMDTISAISRAKDAQI